MHPLTALVDDSRVDSRVRDRVTSRVPGNTRPRVSASTHPAGRRSRPGRMARCRRSTVAATTTWSPDRVGCSVFLNNRYQDPTLGTFLSVDPLVSTTGDPYLYANGNPSTFSDPSGLCPTFGVSADGKHGGSYDDGKGPCGVKHGSFEVPGRFQNKQFTSVSVPIDAPGLRLYGEVTIDLFISASQAGFVGAHDEGNDRDFYRGAPPSASKVQIHLDFVNGVATAIAAPTCDKNGEGCHDARAWQVVTSASEAIDASMNNIFISSTEAVDVLAGAVSCERRQRFRR